MSSEIDFVFDRRALWGFSRATRLAKKRDLVDVSGIVSFFSGPTNGAFGKPCLCPRDTRHFRHFRRFMGFEQQNPCFYLLECKFVIFAVFVKNPLLFGGTKARFTKSTVSWTPIFLGNVMTIIEF